MPSWTRARRMMVGRYPRSLSGVTTRTEGVSPRSLRTREVSSAIQRVVHRVVHAAYTQHSPSKSSFGSFVEQVLPFDQLESQLCPVPFYPPDHVFPTKPILRIQFGTYQGPAQERQQARRPKVAKGTGREGTSGQAEELPGGCGQRASGRRGQEGRAGEVG